ncbi:3-hydroxyacyl-CoA dehydrogenase family protein [Pollutibacter soli]|uniref:3-hydroxyacyl-CoA dehydrogenase family protein n=1 Tax=Pollutibacter soli TaxID=3034157 RepID=UPI003013CFDE
MADQKIILYADDQRKEDFLSRILPERFQVLAENSLKSLNTDCTAYFFLMDITPDFFSAIKLNTDTPVFIDAINFTLGDFPKANPIAILNGWPGFLKNDLLEISYSDVDQPQIENFLNKVRWKFTRIADQAGLAVPRVVSMMINEACFAVAENVSTPEEIDVSMKIGTNYPYGPFEWSRIIGPNRIISLLQVLQKENPRYQPAFGIDKILQEA